MLNYSSVDGFILALSKETQMLNKLDHFKELKKDQIPLIMFDRVSGEIDCDKVIVDDKDASKKAIKYLVSTGCKNIAIISSISDLSVGKLRLEGAREEISNHYGLKLIELSIKNIDTKEEEIGFFLKNNQIDAVLGLDETAAAITINMANKLKYKIPEKISVIGFTDGLLSKYSYPKLSTVSQHAEELGSKAAKILLDRLKLTSEDTYKTKTEIVKTSLILRDSTN